MTDQIPEELQSEMAAAEQEADRAMGVVVKPMPEVPEPPNAFPSFPQWAAQQQDPRQARALPLSDLRERLQLLQEASVDSYEDGAIKIHFDMETRRALLRPMGPQEKW